MTVTFHRQQKGLFSQSHLIFLLSRTTGGLEFAATGISIHECTSTVELDTHTPSGVSHLSRYEWGFVPSI